MSKISLNRRWFKAAFSLLVMGWLCLHAAHAQLLAGKTNALLWANLTPNLSLELVTSEHTSVAGSLFYSGNRTLTDIGLKGGDFQVRYWVSGRPLVQSFIALAVQGMQYTTDAFSEYHHRGYAAGPGLVYGYALPLTKRFNIEFSAGVSLVWFREQKYEKNFVGTREYNHTGHKLMPMGLGISCVYIFK